MASNYRKLGEFIREIDRRNTENRQDNLLGLSVAKCFIPSIANTVGTDFRKYKVVEKGQFAYIPDTSRRGDKIAIALLEDWDSGLVSNVYTVFEVAKEGLLPKYLELWFRRPEFDRYARFKSHGSVRELFDWEQLCDVELPVPSLGEQRKIVGSFLAIEHRIASLQQLNDKLALAADTVLVNHYLSKSDSTSSLGEIISFANGKARPKSAGNIPVYGGNGIMDWVVESNASNIVIIGRVGAYCGSVYLEEEPCWVSDNAIRAKSRISSEEYFDYVLLKHLDLFSHHIGTGQQLLTQGILSAISCPAIDADEMNELNSELRPLVKAIKCNEIERRCLEKIRSLLLSRLGL